MHATAQDLCRRLVGEAPHRERMLAKIAEIEALRVEPGMADLVRTGVYVPIAGKRLRILRMDQWQTECGGAHPPAG